MSYSRWSNSVWYSFWNTVSGPSREEQILSLWYNLDLCKDWTYEELKNMTLEDLMIEYAGVPYNEIKEAKHYIDAFIHDVDNSTDAELLESFTEYIAGKMDDSGVDNNP